MSFNGDLYPTAGADVVMTTKGDVVRYDSQRERYGIGSTGQVLSVTAGLPAWATLTTADSVLTTQGDVLYEGAAGLARLGFGTSGDVLTTKGTGANPVWETPAGGGKLEKLGEYSEATEVTSFVFTPSSPIDMSDYSAVICYYSYDVAYSGVTAFDWGLQIDNNSGTNYHFIGYTQDATTLTGFQTISGSSFPITDTNQNTNGSPKNYGQFILTADLDGTYYNIQSWSNGWNRDTRTMFGEKVTTLSDIDTLDFDSSGSDGILNSLFQFYGVAR